jgi:hypothetical protein
MSQLIEGEADLSDRIPCLNSMFVGKAGSGPTASKQEMIFFHAARGIDVMTI